MTIQIDWAGTSVTPGGVAYEVYVPKADLQLIQATPTEIRRLNVDTFRLTLRDMEEDLDGRPWPQTHRHNTEVTIGGLTYARQVILLDPYSLTFEDGQYAVEIVGANSNLADKANVNQVSVRPQNSAGLISTPLIEYSSFDEAVNIDKDNITGRARSGTLGTTGSKAEPVDNVPDALLIDEVRGFRALRIIGDLTIDGGESYDVANKSLLGIHPSLCSVTLGSDAETLGCYIYRLTLAGTLDGNAAVECCVVNNLYYISGCITTCMLYGTVEIVGSDTSNIRDCTSGGPNGVFALDMSAGTASCIVHNHSGDIDIEGLVDADQRVLISGRGKVTVTSSCTAGTVILDGEITLDDQRPDGSTCTINTAGSVNQVVIADSVLDESLADHDSAGTLGKVMSEVRGRHFGRWNIPQGTNQMVCYDEADNVLITFNLFKADGSPAIDGIDVYDKVPV